MYGDRRDLHVLTHSCPTQRASDLDGRVASIDSQAYGFRARAIANERRKDDPSFSKSNVFVAEVMEKWYRGQVARMANPKSRPIQNSLDFGLPADGNASPYPWHHSEGRARAEINALIEDIQLDADENVSDRSEEHTSELQSLMHIPYAVLCLKKQ